jgi:hypothetical protein
MGSQRPHAVPALAAAVLLLIALGHHPYGYYTFLRWAVCSAALVVAWVAWRSDAKWATWLFIGIGTLFNPLAPGYLQRSTWRPIDVICAIAFVLALSLRVEISHTGTAAKRPSIYPLLAWLDGEHPSLPVRPYLAHYENLSAAERSEGYGLEAEWLRAVAALPLWRRFPAVTHARGLVPLGRRELLRAADDTERRGSKASP